MRMVLAHFGSSISEEDLRALCDCTVWGTRAGDAVAAARNLGFSKTAKHNLDIDSLKELLDLGLYPIVFVEARLHPDSQSQKHAVVVVKVGESEVEVLDPTRGEISLSIEDFEGEWKHMRRLAILIEK